MFDEPLDPPKLIDLLEREFLPQFGTQTAYQYRHAVKKLAISLGCQPTPRDLRSHVIDWMETRLTIMGQTPDTVRGIVQLRRDRVVRGDSRSRAPVADSPCDD